MSHVAPNTRAATTALARKAEAAGAEAPLPSNIRANALVIEMLMSQSRV